MAKKRKKRLFNNKPLKFKKGNSKLQKRIENFTIKKAVERASGKR